MPEKPQIQKFKSILETYSKRRRKLLTTGKSQYSTQVGYWAMSNPLQIFELFKQIELNKNSSFVDLGSGDGIITATASLFTKSSGVEFDSKLHKAATEIKEKLGLSYELKNLNYLDELFYETLWKYDTIFINPDNYFHKLEKILVERFSGTLIITENIFQPLTLKPIKQICIRGTKFNIYNLKKI